MVPIVTHYLTNNRPQNVQRHQLLFHTIIMILQSVILKLVMLVLLKFHQPMFYRTIHDWTIVMTRNCLHQRTNLSIEKIKGKKHLSSQRWLLQPQHHGLPKNSHQPIFESLMAATGRRHSWQENRLRESMLNSGEIRQWKMTVRWQMNCTRKSLGTMNSVPGRAKNYSQLVEKDSNTKRRNKRVLSMILLKGEAK